MPCCLHRGTSPTQIAGVKFWWVSLLLQFHNHLAVDRVQEYKHMKAEEKAKLEGKAAH